MEAVDLRIGLSKAVTTMLILAMLSSTFAYTVLGAVAPSGDSYVKLTGVINDQGIDDDGDGKFEALNIGIEVNVLKEAMYGIELRGLVASDGTIIDVTPEILIQSYKVGVTEIWVRVSGQWIYSSGKNPVKVQSIKIRDQLNLDYTPLSNAPLSREYRYTEFLAPGATLTGKITDRGVDEDGNGKFDYLQIGVELNATSAGFYRIGVSGYLTKTFGYSGNNETYAEKGIQMAQVRLEGEMFYYAVKHLSSLDWVSLADQNGNVIQMIRNIPLSREYNYTQFDAPAVIMTGKILDKGIDLDGDGKFDILQIDVGVNVTASGPTSISMYGLKNGAGGFVPVGGYNYNNTDVGTKTVSIKLDGSSIYAFKMNVEQIGQISLTTMRHVQQDLIDVPLSRTYQPTEFDSPQVNIGDYVKYAVNATWKSSNPQATAPSDQIKELNGVRWLKVEVQNITNTVTILKTDTYINGTEKTLDPITNDIKSQFLTYIIPSKLNPGDNIPGFVKVQSVREASYGGSMRNIVKASFNMSNPTFNMTSVFDYDRLTGMLCEMNMTTRIAYGGESSSSQINMKLAETNLWKKTSAVTCTVTEATVEAGSQVHVTGTIGSNLSGETVTVTYTKPDGSTVNRTVTTGANGAFSDAYTLTDAGQWKVAASWAGNAGYTGATSSLNPITVSPKQEVDIPLGFAVIGVIGAALIIFLRKNSITPFNSHD
jgi:hypothetical protein